MRIPITIEAEPLTHVRELRAAAARHLRRQRGDHRKASDVTTVIIRRKP